MSISMEQQPPSHITPRGIQVWVDSAGLLHREDDQPAIIFPFGCRVWYRHGQLHREKDQPALVCFQGCIYRMDLLPEPNWTNDKEDHYFDFRNGGATFPKHIEIHLPLDEETKTLLIIRNLAPETLPDHNTICIDNTGLEIWSQDGQIGREQDQPAVVSRHHQEWWTQGQRHREGDQPAFMYLDDLGSWFHAWFQHDHLHRDQKQPAILCSDGYTEKWINGVSQEYISPPTEIKHFGDRHFHESFDCDAY